MNANTKPRRLTLRQQLEDALAEKRSYQEGFCIRCDLGCLHCPICGSPDNTYHREDCPVDAAIKADAKRRAEGSLSAEELLLQAIFGQVRNPEAGAARRSAARF
jgi:hypothetical protein